MSKKNSNVILKRNFKGYKNLAKVYLNFKKKIDVFKKKTFLVAVSGGPDSLALVALTKAYQFEKKSEFFYVLINHNIRKNSSKEAKQVQILLKKYNIRLNILLNKKKITKNIQGQARSIRYQMLLNFCKNKNIKTILTAHNLEDQVETFFIRLSRGSGLTGLSSMQPLSKLNKSVNLSRPLLDIKKEMLKRISKLVFGKFFKDPSNVDDKYLRTKIRKLKTPLENSGINYDQIFRSIKNLAVSRITLEKYVSQITKKLVIKSKGQVSVNFSKFCKLDDEIKSKIIYDSIKHVSKNYYNPRFKKVHNLIKTLKFQKDMKNTLGGCIILKNKGKLIFRKEKM